ADECDDRDALHDSVTFPENQQSSKFPAGTGLEMESGWPSTSSLGFVRAEGPVEDAAVLDKKPVYMYRYALRCGFRGGDYSSRSATIGSTREARCAGITHAAAATSTNDPAAHAYTKGAAGVTP